MKALNRYRACRLNRALRRYDTADDLTDCLVDFLADASHWCERTRVSFLELDRKAFRHYREECTAARKEAP